MLLEGAASLPPLKRSEAPPKYGNHRHIDQRSLYHYILQSSCQSPREENSEYYLIRFQRHLSLSYQHVG